MPVVSLLELMATGAIAGLMAGFLGIGGGVILTPLCLFIFPTIGVQGDSLIKIVFGTNMFLVTVFSLSAVMAHHANRNIDWYSVAIIGPLAVIGSIAGAGLASSADPAILQKGFALLLAVSSTMLAVRGSTKPGGNVAPKPLVPGYLLPLLGLTTGILASFLGVGGGAIMVPALILLFGIAVERVAATSSSVIVFIGLAGMVSYMWHGQGITGLPPASTGYIWWMAAIPIMLTGIPSARFGALLNARTNAIWVRRIMGMVLFATALRLLFFE